MSLKEQAREWMKQIAANHVAKNCRRYQWTTYTGALEHNAFGGVSYLPPIEGTVVNANEVFTLVKTSPNTFCVILTKLLSCPVAIGAKVAVRFYAPRRFDQTLADGSEDARDEDGVRTVMLTGTETLFPVKWDGRYLGINERHSGSYREIQNPYLRDLITQMEKMPVNGGLRRVVNVLVDANATNLSFVDPADEEATALTPPAILARVSTGQFTGDVEILYRRSSDTYEVRLKRAQNAVQANEDAPAGGQPEQEVIEDVYFDSLGDVLINAIDDGTWNQAKVTVLKPAPKTKVKSVA